MELVLYDEYLVSTVDTLIARFMGPIWGQQDPAGPHELCYLGTDGLAL